MYLDLRVFVQTFQAGTSDGYAARRFQVQASPGRSKLQRGEPPVPGGLDLDVALPCVLDASVHASMAPVSVASVWRKNGYGVGRAGIGKNLESAQLDDGEGRADRRRRKLL